MCFDVPQLARIINRSDALKRPCDCFATFVPYCISFIASPTKSDDPDLFFIEVSIPGAGIDWQFSHLTQVLSQISTVTSNMVDFAIELGPRPITPKPEDVDDVEWLQLLSLFPSLRTLFVPAQFAGYVSHALEDSPGMTAAGVLPALDMLCLEGQPVLSVDGFIAARRDSGLPVTVVNSRNEFKK